MFDFGSEEVLQKNKKCQLILNSIMFGHLLISKIENIGKDARREILEVRLINS